MSEFLGWRVKTLRSGDVEAHITLDVGPRVVGLVAGGQNLFFVKPETQGQTGLEGYQGYGGHRLWVAPEVFEITYYPENEPVEVISESETHLEAASAVDAWGLRRILRVEALGEGRFAVDHRIEMHGPNPMQISVWALSVMAAGGECWFPNPPFVAHSEKVLPASPLVLWHYTNLADPRWTFEREGIRLRQTVEGESQKIGAFVWEGWAAYALGDWVFKKTFPTSTPERLPDYGCNFETFTRTDMLEVETLGPLVTLNRGEAADHREEWVVRAMAPNWAALRAL